MEMRLPLAKEEFDSENSLLPKWNSTSNKDVFLPETVYANDFAGIALSQEGVK